MKKILIIEDNVDVRENTTEILELADYDVITAENGKVGVALAIQENPDLIICDIIMPVLDGYGVLHLLSKNEKTSGIPFIFLTSNAERSDVRKGMAMGADDYLTKPFDDQEFLHVIETRLQKQELLKKKFTKNIEGVQNFINEARSFESLRQISTTGEGRYYQKKDTVFREGAYPKGAYFINKGKIKIFHKNDQGKELISSLHREGDFFGFISLLKNEPYNHSAAVLEDAEVYMIPKEDFFSLIYKNSEVARKFIGILSDNLIENEQQLIRLAYDSVRKRVAEALVKLSDTYKKENDKHFSMDVSREDLANMVGTAKETVIRTLSDFKEYNYIEVSGSIITILEYDKLVNLKN
nr:response regulator [uncultured Fluviicola sp.]